ncbi:UNVERIFIED_CONTAM: hypothetical protein Sradi_5942200 [Sesamum radiatum]|uniref:Uncharacterized protein n=1 Tax=Sesamum radiatum TaxID=300843 RepID=A0AAW2KUF1_SESRA
MRDGQDRVDAIKKQENFRKRDIMDKKSQFCSHCDKSGHTRETCFKLHGYPEWYKTMQEQKKRDGRNFNAHMTQDKVIETKPGFNAHMTQDKMTETKSGQGNVNSADISEAWQELLKLIKGKGPQDPLQINFAHALDDFAGTGYDLNYLDANDSNFWIVDTGATSHMCARLDILSNPHPPHIKLRSTYLMDHPNLLNSLAVLNYMIN